VKNHIRSETVTKTFLAMTALTCVAIGSAALPTQPLQAQTAQAEVDAQQVVAQVREILAERYVLPERRPVLDAALAKGLETGRYDTTDPNELAQRINADLVTAGQDKHLNFVFDPARAAMLSSPSSGGSPNEDGLLRSARAANHGIRKLKVLPGNVRYIDFDLFRWTGTESQVALANAMRFLSDGDAVIIDLRYNGGGSPTAVQHLISYFLPPNRPLVDFYMNADPEPDRRSTLAELGAERMVGKPLWVLTSAGTGSAAEEFAGHVAGFKIGELVGGTTAGAAFRNTYVVVQDRFVLSVSIGRPVLAATGGDWESTGIAPTIEVSPDQALDVAHADAIRTLLAKAPEGDRTQLTALAEGIAARTNPRTAALPLSAYVGNYGDRHVIEENGRLYYRRSGRPTLALVPLGGNAFVEERNPAIRLTFAVEGGKARSVRQETAGSGSALTFNRSD
jgi:hypothetical protein